MPSLARYTSEILGRPYRLGGAAGETGADCFNTLWAYLQMRYGAENLPTEYEGLTIDTYADLYQKDPEQAKCIMIRLIKDILSEISPERAVAGDILRVECKLGVDVIDFPAIDAGNGKLLISTQDEGVCVVNKRFYHIREAYTWRALQ